MGRKKNALQKPLKDSVRAMRDFIREFKEKTIEAQKGIQKNDPGMSALREKEARVADRLHQKQFREAAILLVNGVILKFGELVETAGIAEGYDEYVYHFYRDEIIQMVNSSPVAGQIHEYCPIAAELLDKDTEETEGPPGRFSASFEKGGFDTLLTLTVTFKFGEPDEDDEEEEEEDDEYEDEDEDWDEED